MHLCIPDSEEVTEPVPGQTGKFKQFIKYNIYINGSFHCSARYSELLLLHKQLEKVFGKDNLEQFPKKTIFALKQGTPDDVTRRLWLQRYVQRIGQEPKMVGHEVFQSFLLNMQKEVQRDHRKVMLKIYFPNGEPTELECYSSDQLEDVLENVCRQIGLATELTYYFGLFLVQDASNGGKIVRRLQDFESPFISLERAGDDHKIFLKRAYWEYVIQDEKVILSNKVATTLVYQQAMAEVSDGILKPSDDLANELKSLQDDKDKSGYIKACYGVSHYGEAYFSPQKCDFPEEDTDAVIYIGFTTVFVTWTSASGEPKEQKFEIERVRCWKTMLPEEEGGEVELAFHYCTDMQNGSMRWVKVKGDQTIHMAMCLQHMVDELVRKHRKEPWKAPADREGKYKARVKSKEFDVSFLGATILGPSRTVPDANDGASGADTGPASPASGKLIIQVKLSDLQSACKKAGIEDYGDDDDEETRDEAGGLEPEADDNADGKDNGDDDEYSFE